MLQAIEGKDTWDGKSSLVVAYSAWNAHVKPGATFEDHVDLTSIYDLSQPGKYTVQVQRTDAVSKTLVKSNTVTVTVTP